MSPGSTLVNGTILIGGESVPFGFDTSDNRHRPENLNGTDSPVKVINTYHQLAIHSFLALLYAETLGSSRSAP